MDRARRRPSPSASPARAPSSATRAGWPTRSAPTTTSSRSLWTRDYDDLRQLVWHLDEPLADLSSLGFLPLCELAREHVTVALSGQGADELLRRLSQAPRGRRSPGAGSSCRAPSAPVPAPRCGTAPGRAGRLAEALQAPDPIARAAGLQRLGASRAARRAVRRRARGARHARPRRSFATGSPAAPGRRPAGGGALPRRAPGPGGRHAHLLRPRVDGVLARGARAVPRPRARRAVRPHPGRAQGAQAQGQARPAARRAGPGAGLRAGQAQARLLQRGRGDVAGCRRTARSSTHLLLAPRPRVRGRRRPRPRCERVVQEWRAGPCRHSNLLLALVMLELVARRVPPARPAPPSRMRAAA